MKGLTDVENFFETELTRQTGRAEVVIHFSVVGVGNSSEDGVGEIAFLNEVTGI